ncbi:Hypothetical protein NTJ_08481 [Nesidiocoris tenuis]|uniref:Uncharacterized protein n=1 Tax=Nesidiocoris tenuis TaxID=355587 RepID=A0ABN7AWB8_9HEMI|nr:Hypothetical protein NTJ_08481 [Nesidiocoris tenuis]
MTVGGPGGGSAPLGALPAAAPGTKSPPPTGAGSGGQSSAGNGAALPANFEASLCRLISYCARSRHVSDTFPDSTSPLLSSFMICH